MGLAAAVGTFRRAGADALAPLHDGLSRVAGLVGIPLAGAGVVGNLLSDQTRPRLTRIALILGAGFGLLALILNDDAFRLFRTLGTGSVMGVTMALSARARNAMGVAAPVLVLFAGLGVAGAGDWLGFDRQGWFHLVMAVGMVAFGVAARPDVAPGDPVSLT